MVPGLDALMTTWQTLVDEGVVAIGGGGGGGAGGGDIPMTIGSSNTLRTIAIGRGAANNNNSTAAQPAQRQGVLLPGGYAGLNPSGFAISAGTQYPDQAYALVKYLSNDPTISSSFFGVVPARQSLRSSSGTTSLGNGNIVIGGGPLDSSQQQVIDDGLASAIPYSEYRFSNYIGQAVNLMSSQGLDAVSALQQVEAEAVTNLQTADARKGTSVVYVATPIPTPVLQPGEVVLKFGIQQGFGFGNVGTDWQTVIDQFVASDPQVGQVILDTPLPGTSLEEMPSKYDCFYLGYNAVPNIDLSLILNLDPFMDTDPSFSRTDVVGNTLAQLQMDNRTYAFPIDIQPSVLRYDPQQFASAGVPEPSSGWTVDQFVDALNQLKQYTGDTAPFNARDFGGSYLLMLIAAYGGLPFDYRTNPATINFTDPATVSAIQQVLDLAKTGLIDYQAQGQGNFVVGGPQQGNPPIYTANLTRGGGFGGFGGGPGGGGNGGGAAATYNVTTYPTGSQYTPISYSIGSAYISANAQNPDACYRLISTIAQQTELFGAMPARRSQINDPNLAASQGTSTVAAYQQLDTMMQDPNAIVFPAITGGGTGASTAATFLTRLWLNRAFDNYVLNDMDLTTQLEDAQTYATGFVQCTDSLPPFDAGTQTQQEYLQSILSCATQVDPSFSF
jgi:maltose-binding protein MalE